MSAAAAAGAARLLPQQRKRHAGHKGAEGELLLAWSTCLPPTALTGSRGSEANKQAAKAAGHKEAPGRRRPPTRRASPSAPSER